MGVAQDPIVVDLHADTLQDVAAGKRDLDGRTGKGHVDLPRMQRGGLDVQVFAAYIAPKEAATGSQRARELIAAFQRTLARNNDRIVHVRTVAEIEAAVRAGRAGAILSIENGGDAIGRDLAQIDRLHVLGVRMMGITWNKANPLGDGAEETVHGGLTPLGREAVERMQRLGLIVDVSHASETTFWDVLDAAHRPIVASHSGAMAVYPHRRNLTDEQLRAIARRGGVVGAIFYPAFLGEATLQRVTAHIAHMVQVMGIDHVALGSDFDGITEVPQGLEDVSRLPNLTQALLERGYTAEEVQKILGGNALRVFREVWGS